MPLHPVRLLAIPFGGVAFALDVVLGEALPEVPSVSNLVIAVGVPLGVFILACRPWRAGEPIVVGDRVVLPASPATAGLAIPAFGLAGVGVVREGTFAVDAADVAAFIAFGLIGIASVLLWRPRLVLDRDGATVQRIFGSDRFLWRDLETVKPIRGGLNLVYRNGSTETVTTGSLHAPPPAVAALLQQRVNLAAWGETAA
jgi:hypothetical protein